jgi:hypothetical protein
MIFNKALAAAMLALTAAPLAAAATAAATGDLPRFDQVELNGGGTVTVRHGAVQRVRFLSGNADLTPVRVQERNRRLVIDACKRNCPRNYRLHVEIVTPSLVAASINGGGRLTVEPGFAGQASLAAAVSGGGDLDARGIPARTAATAVKGGGQVRVRAQKSLVAAVSGGGRVLYWGEPQVTTTINGGGTVSKGR